MNQAYHVPGGTLRKEERCDDVHRKNRHVPVAIQPLREERTGTVMARTDRRGVTCRAQNASRPTPRCDEHLSQENHAAPRALLVHHCQIRRWWRELRSRDCANPQCKCLEGSRWPRWMSISLSRNIDNLHRSCAVRLLLWNESVVKMLEGQQLWEGRSCSKHTKLKSKPNQRESRSVNWMHLELQPGRWTGVHGVSQTRQFSCSCVARLLLWTAAVVKNVGWMEHPE